MTLAELQALCVRHGVDVRPQRRPATESYPLALRDHLWAKEHPGQPLPLTTAPFACRPAVTAVPPTGRAACSG